MRYDNITNINTRVKITNNLEGFKQIALNVVKHVDLWEASLDSVWNLCSVYRKSSCEKLLLNEKVTSSNDMEICKIDVEIDVEIDVKIDMKIDAEIDVEIVVKTCGNRCEIVSEN